MRAKNRILIAAGALLAALHAPSRLDAFGAEKSPSPPPLVCDVVFYGRVVNVTKPERGLVSLTVVVDVVEKASKPVCAPAGTFRIRLPSTHPIAKESEAVRKVERKYRMTGGLGEKSEKSLVVIGAPR